MPEEKFSVFIKKISNTGVAIVKFNRDVYEFPGDITDKIVGRALIGTEKPWVEVAVIPGEYSDPSKLGFNHTVQFVDSQIMEIKISFEQPDQVSLF